MKYGKPLNYISRKLGRSWFNNHKRPRIIRKITIGEKDRWLNAVNFLITVVGLSLKLLLTRLTVLMLTLALCVAVLDSRYGML
jgi:hypothetical protein